MTSRLQLLADPVADAGIGKDPDHVKVPWL